MIIRKLEIYDTIIGMPFLMQQQASIDCHELSFQFPNPRVRVNCPPTGEYVRVVVVSTAKIMEQQADMFPW